MILVVRVDFVLDDYCTFRDFFRCFSKRDYFINDTVGLK